MNFNRDIYDLIIAVLEMDLAWSFLVSSEKSCLFWTQVLTENIKTFRWPI